MSLVIFEQQNYDMNIVDIVAALICEDANIVKDFYAAVACVEYRGTWLLGLSTAADDRHNLWCFPGGGINSAETPEQAAVRECREEMGVRCKAVGKAFRCHGKPGVAFVYCKALGKPVIKHNKEFKAAGFFSLRDMKSLKLYPNVKQLIRRC